MCSCHSILECCVTFSGVKLSIRLFVLFLGRQWGKTETSMGHFLLQNRFESSLNFTSLQGLGLCTFLLFLHFFALALG